MLNVTKPDKETTRWTIISVLILLVILIPFFLYGDQIEAWFKDFTTRAQGYPAASFAVIAALLGSDILLPIPSSLVSTAAGILLGILYGTLASFLGLTISCLIGYTLGSFSAPAMQKILLKPRDIQHLNRMYLRFGDWIILITRPVPVLAESAVLFAGIGRMPFTRFLALSSLSNLGISLLYAITGRLAGITHSLPLAFAGAILLPLVILLVYRLFKPAP
jgi:membrane protein DedA with SNARE-associated domain